jgi:hypothetical protein
MHRDVGQRDMRAAAIGIGIDHDTANAHLAKRAQNTNGNLAAICDQDGVQFVHATTLSSSLVGAWRAGARRHHG